MNTIPQFEELLLEVHQSLGLDRPQTSQKKRFAAGKMREKSQKKMREKLLGDIFKTLDMDDNARRDIRKNINDWCEFYVPLGKHLRKGKASKKQVIWHLLFYAYVPGLSRHLAFWAANGGMIGKPIDAGMPGGRFWFLPELKDGKVELPISRVLDWLIDLLGGTNQEETFGGLEKENSDTEDPLGSLLRKLRKWKHEGVLPKSSNEVNDTFHDEAKLHFLGAIEFKENMSEKERFDVALSFVEEKKLNAQKLALEIPISKAQLEPILNRHATEQEKKFFTDEIGLRYQKPGIKTIRQRLHIAKLVQDGYKRLLKFLCGKDVELTCADPKENKLLQPLNLFMHVYNLTIDAYNYGKGNLMAENVYFLSQLTENERPFLLSILVGDQKSVADMLSNQFSQLAPDSPLEDMIVIRERDKC